MKLLRTASTLAAAAFLYAPLLSAFTPDFGKSRLKKSEEQASYWVFGPKNEFVAGVGVVQKMSFPISKSLWKTMR